MRERLAGGIVQAMAAHSPLSARLAEEAGFDAVWASGFELSALYGVPDASLRSFSQHLEMTRNHAIRASVAAMREAFTAIRADGGLARADRTVAPLEEILRLQRMDEHRAAERRYLTDQGEPQCCIRTKSRFRNPRSW